MVTVAQECDLPGLVRKAVNLSTYLGPTQQLLVRPVRTADKFEKALWLSDLPEHPAVHSAHRAANPDADSPVLPMDRVPKLDPPSYSSSQNGYVCRTFCVGLTDASTSVSRF